ncbi:hypothetical protein HMPREF1051_0510 [Neisseria sicca VK64]|uniref:Uncharacterized protein n=1 Tax=Neisseria sicca VK64 TaxID=1095748 RepID=I2NEA4_NEISI|nr:hypothetical protein HMPREF1051_0510 [Neisseria sicca VK64]
MGCRNLAVCRINSGAGCYRSESLIQTVDACACGTPKGRLKKELLKVQLQQELKLPEP